jgi:CheY-like chemotaxis protein
MPETKTLLAVINDLMFQSRVSEHAQALGYDITVAHTPSSLRAALERAPALVILDLHVAGLDWRDVVALARARDVPVLAFGRHTEAPLLRQAREAGCERVVPRSQLVEELPQLIRELAATSA